MGRCAAGGGKPGGSRHKGRTRRLCADTRDHDDGRPTKGAARGGKPGGSRHKGRTRRVCVDTRDNDDGRPAKGAATGGKPGGPRHPRRDPFGFNTKQNARIFRISVAFRVREESRAAPATRDEAPSASIPNKPHAFLALLRRLELARKGGRLPPPSTRPRRPAVDWGQGVSGPARPPLPYHSSTGFLLHGVRGQRRRACARDRRW